MYTVIKTFILTTQVINLNTQEREETMNENHYYRM